MRRDGIPLASCSSKGVVDKSYSLKLNFKTDERPICFQREQNNSDPVMKYFKTYETTNVQFVSSETRTRTRQSIQWWISSSKPGQTRDDQKNLGRSRSSHKRIHVAYTFFPFLPRRVDSLSLSLKQMPEEFHLFS